MFSRIIPIKRSKFLIQQTRIKNIFLNFSRKNRQKTPIIFQINSIVFETWRSKILLSQFSKKCYSLKNFIILISYNFTLLIRKIFSNLLIQKRKVNWIKKKAPFHLFFHLFKNYFNRISEENEMKFLIKNIINLINLKISFY